MQREFPVKKETIRTFTNWNGTRRRVTDDLELDELLAKLIRLKDRPQMTADVAAVAALKLCLSHINDSKITAAAMSLLDSNA